MARRSTRTQAPALEQQADPSAPLNASAFLAAAQGVLRTVAEDLLQRADGSPLITEALKARWQTISERHHTADPYDVWRRRFVDQVAAAWLLSLVFVRTLEDRGLLDANRIAGPGAMDSQRQFLDLAPYLTERDYLLTVFQEVARFDAAKDLFDRKHNPLWKLAPTAEGARALLGLFRQGDPEAPSFRFGQKDTRFLGDLYQDLNEEVRQYYALLQTPDFVESYILDRTLEPAIKQFGLEGTTLIDPTCGSGHFLLGAFERLTEHWARSNPGLGIGEAAKRALGAIYGVDINPYAVAIVRFRLVLAYLERIGAKKLNLVEQPPLNIIVADTLLHGGENQQNLADQAGAKKEEWLGKAFALEDEERAKELLVDKHYAAVVGNPPYITVKDAALRDIYRQRFPAAAIKQYSLAAPFADRFFRLALPGGYVGQITANSFMKREFGKGLITKVFPNLDLFSIINTSGAYIPGHGTPTVILFGRNQLPTSPNVHAVLAKRGEPSTPDIPEQGAVWRSICDHGDELKYEDEYISVTRLARSTLASHPWSLGGGGASELKELLEQNASQKLSELVEGIGRTTVAGEDDVWITESGTWKRRGLGDNATPLVIGECVRDWTLTNPPEILYPYQTIGGETLPESHPIVRVLWPWRTLLGNRTVFGKRMQVVGRPWWEHLEHYRDKLRTPLSITFAFVATHNHFVLDRGGKVFNRTAPVIKLPPLVLKDVELEAQDEEIKKRNDALRKQDEDRHLALLGYLNSSTACFWMKQVVMNKGATSDKGVLQADEDKFRYEFDGTKLRETPLPPPKHSERLIPLAKGISELASSVITQSYLNLLKDQSLDSNQLLASWRQLDAEYESARKRCVALQEEIDWLVYDAFGLLTDDNCLRTGEVPSNITYNPDDRPFRKAPESGDVDHLVRCARRNELLNNSNIRLIEESQFKRRWYQSQGKFNAEAVTNWTFRQNAYEQYVLGLAESVCCVGETVITQKEIERELSTPLSRLERVYQDTFSSMSSPWEDLIGRIKGDAVPYLAALRYTEPGLEKRGAWERTWELQRQEDATTLDTKANPIPVPPKYDSKDFRDASYWRLRGKLDVAKERFIAYPGCESDEDKSPVYGWAGWNHLQQAQALVALYQSRKDGEGWGPERLVPMLAGLLELLPWLLQWHNEPCEAYDGARLGQMYKDFVESQCLELQVTLEDLKRWRPVPRSGRASKATKGRARKATKGAEGASSAEEDLE